MAFLVLMGGLGGSLLSSHGQEKRESTMITGLSVAFIHSGNGEKLAQWYSKTLGLEIGASHPAWTEFKMPSGSRFAVDHTAFPRSVVENQSIVLSFAVEDINKAVRDLAGRGVQFYPSAEKAVYDVGPQLVASFADPDGNWVQLNQRKKQ